ncbi:MAG: cystine ABC transporter substrate-binding protein, partial [Chitinimonas sp.]|nr:cystine ABC transporter substrate-binding protein [Chitinimonas sp.]
MNKRTFLTTLLAVALAATAGAADLLDTVKQRG